MHIGAQNSRTLKDFQRRVHISTNVAVAKNWKNFPDTRHNLTTSSLAHCQPI